ncbi:MAG: helix-turn-helix transcriptional regulator [Gemmiger sp.]|uniref:helix-turn-helix domain-containing protein n=1 Tax=Gemmiger sp. TaxID=2049027 RepID=UPI002A90E433|nr:helix-turn-helix transcriptional regulator [Gemmiger sp.]MDY5325463.1 helix-turn-helix transcriptional regulator [Gemmiger sp.]
MDYANIYVERIRSLCETRSISINKLATMSNVKQSTLDNIMRGLTKNPRVKTLHKIALAFNMTLAEFLDFPTLNEYSFDDEEEDD